ncbi:MAG TPA: hypothetical protein VF761_15425 [Gemmatimonadaceae bacterium]
MRAYDVAVGALALDVDRKWLDNLIAHHDIRGVERFARGVSRRLSMRALLTAAIVRDLQRELAVPAARAVEIAQRLLAGHHSDLALTPALSVRLDLAALEREIAHRLIHAMETAAPRRRGRPPGHSRKSERGTP